MGFLLRALGRKVTGTLDEFAQTPEGKAAIERGERTMAVARTAQETAGSGLDDRAACAELRASLPEDPEAARGAIAHLGEMRTDYLNDRAYRLLSAAIDGAPVRPIDRHVLEQFSEEAKLGRMSLNDGFAYLASLEPSLRDLSDPSTKPMGFSRGDSKPDLTGAWAATPHAVLNTDLARLVVDTYLRATHGGRTADDDPAPFFERENRARSGSFAILGRGDTRPRARN